MYNANKKQQFIDTLTSKSIAYKAFNWLQSFEESWNCDLSSQKNKENLQKMLSDLLKRRVSSEDFLIVFRLYIKWCDDCDAFLSVTPDDILDLKNNTVSCPRELQHHLDCIFRKEEDNAVDNVYRAFLWLGFGGIEERDTYELTNDNINLNKRIVEINGLKYPIYNEAFQSIKRCKENKYFVYYNDNYVGGPIERYRYPSNQLLRGIRSEYTFENRMMRVQLSKIQKAAFDNNLITTRISFFNVWRSGIFYREVSRENRNDVFETMFEDVANIMINNGARSYSNKDMATESQKKERIIRDLNRYYKRWIIAHNYV